MKENMRMGNLPANMKKNRVLQIIPYDFNRVILSMKRGQENTDYINASFIDMQYSFIYQALLEYYLYGDTELDVSSLEGHLQKLHNTLAPFDRVGLEEEFKKLTNVRIMKENMRMGNLPANMKKNRVLQIIPYDFNRVILSMKRGQENTDYINASFIDDKCDQYWPDQGCWTYGNVRVAVEDFTILVDYTIRKFCVQYQTSEGSKAPRLITQLHFTSWPDFGVPFTPIGMLKFLKKVKTVNPSFAGPIVVHCSAGVGRTGTFIVIDAMIDMMHAEQKVDVFALVSRIREQRSQLVQTDMQYSFIYQALLEYYLYGDTELDVSSLEGHLQKLHNTLAPFDRVGLEEEFKKLTNVRIMKENMRMGNLPANMKKNRVLQIIPYDFNRVILSMKRGQENTDYINASFIDVSAWFLC
ncbi:UNVERIFIED_CONTAM: hypothetical protein FKN15_043844 [Acipenser sinensis]